MTKATDKIQNKLKNLPARSGVYFFKNKAGEIIYVGKAAVLKNRVRQYFQAGRPRDAKTEALIGDISDVKWVETGSEIDALFLEAEMVKRYMPQYNILLRDDKSSNYVRIDMKSEWPHVSLTRQPLDDGAEYIGPYYSSFAIKKALRYLRRIFPYHIKPVKSNSRSSLDDHIGLNPSNMTSEEYHASLNQLISYIKGNRNKIIKDLDKEMKRAAKLRHYEEAAKIRNQMRYLNEINQRIIFGDREFLDISKDEALLDLMELLNLDNIPSRIEGFDISHMSGTNVVASMVVFINGVSSRDKYRKFKLSQDKNDDFMNMSEIIKRRFSVRNLQSWGLPNLVLIDGGKGQLSAALKSYHDSNPEGKTMFIGLAKRDEQIIVSGVNVNENKVKQLSGQLVNEGQYTTISLPKNCHLIKLLMRIRDESHRFAVSYHSYIKKTKQTSSKLDSIKGIGPKTRQKLIRHFGSLSKLKQSSLEELTNLVGPHKAKLVLNHIKAL